MRTIDLADERMDIATIIAIASDEPVILLTPDGREFCVSEADDFDKELEALRASETFQKFLDGRSQSKRRVALDDIEFEINQELKPTNEKEDSAE